MMKRIGVLTSGGDSPGMNAAIRGVVRTCFSKKVEVFGIFRGYTGLIHEDLKPLSHHSVSNIINRGGTILKTSRCPEFMTPEGRKRAADILQRNSIEGLIAIGGDGTYRGALALTKEYKIPTIGVPGTIDNDLGGTDRTIGSDTAVETALSAIDKIKDTVNSMERIFVVEVMGRNSGFIALKSAMAGGAEQVLIPEVAFDVHAIAEEITEGYIKGKASWIIVVAEGAIKAQELADKISHATDLESRVVVLGHIQRGGSPTAEDRILGGKLGSAAVEALLSGASGKAVGTKCDEVVLVDLEEAVKHVTLNFKDDLRLIKLLT